MSADNAILVLSLKDQYRVTEAGAIDNLYWDYGANESKSEYVISRIFEYFSKAEKFQDENQAFLHASKLYKKSYIVEYGIIPIKINKTWLQVLKEARDYLNSEKMEVIKNDYIKNKSHYIDEINYAYSDVLTALNEEKYAKR